MPIHFDHSYAAKTEFGRPLVDSTFTLALVTGQTRTIMVYKRDHAPKAARPARRDAE